MNTHKYRIYADGRVVHEDEFHIEDSSIPYYDDYETYEIPETLLDHLADAYGTPAKTIAPHKPSPEGNTRTYLTGQRLVDEIYIRAGKTNFSISPPEQSLEVLKTHSDISNESMAMTLVGAWHGKYDLVSILQATLDILTETHTTNHE